MHQTPTLILNSHQIHQRIDRIAFQIYEDVVGEKELIIAGIAKSGYIFAAKLVEALNRICPIPYRLIEIALDKEVPTDYRITPSLSKQDLDNKVIIVFSLSPFK